jgi:hypothetical protein
MAQESLALTAPLKKPAEIDFYNNRIYEKIEETHRHRVLEVCYGTCKITRILYYIGLISFSSLTAPSPWLVSGCRVKRNYLPTESAGIGNRFVPLLKLEYLIGPPCGVSPIAIVV